MANNTKWYWLGGIALFILIIVGWFASSYNGLIASDEQVNAAWGNVESQYQRRVDLIPNLVATVSGAADFEKSTITAVTEARSRWQGATTVGERQGAAQEVDSAIARLLVTVEAYPDLKATQNFLALQDQLEGTENRISVARQDYNSAVKTYNTKVRRLPTNIVAAMFGFETKQPFEAETGAEDAPEVKF